MQAGGEGEVTEVVGGELELPAFRGAEFGGRHHAGVVDEDVERAVPVRDEVGDRLLVGQVQPCADRDGDFGAGGGEDPGGLQSEAGAAAGDDRASAGQVDAVDHLGGGGGWAERVGGAHDSAPYTGKRSRIRLVPSLTGRGSAYQGGADAG